MPFGEWGSKNPYGGRRGEHRAGALFLENDNLYGTRQLVTTTP